MKYLAIIYLFLGTVLHGNTQRMRLDPADNTASMCGDGTRMCSGGVRCLERRMNMNNTVNECETPVVINGSCTPRNFIGGGTGADDLVDEGMFTPVRFQRQRAQGARDRDVARRVTGVVIERACETGTNCMEDVCSMREPTMCDGEAIMNNQVRCMEDGRFQALQCRRQQEAAAASCFCVNQTDGTMISGTMRSVKELEDLPDCSVALRCTFMRALRTALLRDGEASARVEDGQCMSCTCEDGMFSCRPPERNGIECPRYNASETPRTCMINGEEVPHAQRREVGKCNICGCRNGFVRCTRIKECREDAAGDSDMDEEDRQCDECMDMPNGPVCAVRDGRTFPTRCHAMRCQRFERQELFDGPCSERNACSADQPSCGANMVCMRRGSSTLMSREASSPNDRRICINRQELRCRPAPMTDGQRRISPDQRDSAEVGRNTDDNDADSSVCASDGVTYPSTCHMIVESQGDMVPRVMHAGMCRQADPERMVCATDGMTYADETTMRAVGGNVRMDYKGECGDSNSNTPRQRCMRVRESGRCPSLDGCGRRVMTADGCCPVCGSVLVMAMDQEALDEHTQATGDLREMDEYMGRFFRAGAGRDAAISDMATRRCNISMTRPATTPGNNIEVLFQARNTAEDGEYCHEQAMLMEASLRAVADPGAVVANEETFVAAFVVSPSVEDSTDGAVALAASYMMLCTTFLVGFLHL